MWCECLINNIFFDWFSHFVFVQYVTKIFDLSKYFYNSKTSICFVFCNKIAARNQWHQQKTTKIIHFRLWWFKHKMICHWFFSKFILNLCNFRVQNQFANQKKNNDNFFWWYSRKFCRFDEIADKYWFLY